MILIFSIKILITLVIITTNLSGQYNPCYDDLYINLKSKNINSLSSREYHYFSRKDEECSDYNRFDKRYLDQIDIMERNLFNMSEKLNQLSSDIDLSSVYGMGRMTASDPELRSLAIIQSRDDDIQREFNIVMDKLSLLRKEVKNSNNNIINQKPADLIVNSLTVIDSLNGGFIKTVDKQGKNTVMIGELPSGNGAIITYNKKGRPAVKISADINNAGLIETKSDIGLTSNFIGSDSNNNIIKTMNNEGNIIVTVGSNDKGNGEIKVLNLNEKNAALIGVDSKNSGLITVIGNNGNRIAEIVEDDNYSGSINIFGIKKSEKLELKPAIKSENIDSKKND